MKYLDYNLQKAAITEIGLERHSYEVTNPCSRPSIAFNSFASSSDIGMVSDKTDIGRFVLVETTVEYMVGDGAFSTKIYGCYESHTSRIPSTMKVHQNIEYSNTSTYANPELRDFQISSINLLFKNYKTRLPVENGNVIEKAVDLVRQMNLELVSDDVQELLDCHNQEQTIDEFTDMHQQDIEEF
ncbi:hypothetical protein TNCV_2741221 [Trichonephila clavipes]|nr:hypothetical protein TNCV_2741221 [Trichonephila clavipes]